MAETIVENLKILSENFKHNFDVFSNSAIFVNEVNKIRIEKEDDANFKVTYNLHLAEKTVLVPEEAVYHFCLNLFKRLNKDIGMLCNFGKPIEINEWLKIEEAESLGIIASIQKELEYNYRLKYLFLESDRFKTTYFNSLLILEDKQKEFLSNIFNFRNCLAGK
ncbi:hypothetical protein [Flavobacterium tistrianum]|uniref:hypothetical protein n=1 Tax=Flavobacterium tistrianum TaxID=1685414 RepID=UPI000DAE0147|nr:hypothetical protein [Flavobacterium tistrianum]KAF2338159.1 hypothetical protein DMB71_19210 [Flavobacterium tistrianum]